MARWKLLLIFISGIIVFAIGVRYNIPEKTWDGVLLKLIGAGLALLSVPQWSGSGGRRNR